MDNFQLTLLLSSQTEGLFVELDICRIVLTKLCDGFNSVEQHLEGANCWDTAS